MDYPIFSLCADTYDKLPRISKIFNLSTLEYYLWIEIPRRWNREFSLVAIEELTDSSDSCCCKCKCKKDITPYADRACCRPWIKLPTSAINQTVGLHIYRVVLVNQYTNDVISLYFNYVIQNDDPDRPYDYMKSIREGTEEECDCECQ